MTFERKRLLQHNFQPVIHLDRGFSEHAADPKLFTRLIVIWV